MINPDMKYLFEQSYDLSDMQETIEMVLYSVVCFFVPFLIGHPQFLVGTIVNAALILGAFNLRLYKLLPVIVLPSIAVVTKGLIFGPMMLPLLYVIPVIWLGNATLVFLVKMLALKDRKKIVFAGIAKFLIIFLSGTVLVSLGIIPAAIMGSLGVMQLYTFGAGAVIALGIQSGKKQFIR